MTRKLITLAAVVWAGAGDAAGMSSTVESRIADATAVLVDRAGEQVGTAKLTEEAHGVRIVVSVDGLPAGRHGFHVHEAGHCDPPDFTSAGGHFAPDGRSHGMENPAGPHAGDLPNVRVGADGRGSGEVLNPRLTLEGSNGSLLQAEGTSLVIHEQEDDYYTDPSGDSGDRIACGVVRR